MRPSRNASLLKIAIHNRLATVTLGCRNRLIAKLANFVRKSGGDVPSRVHPRLLFDVVLQLRYDEKYFAITHRGNPLLVPPAAFDLERLRGVLS